MTILTSRIIPALQTLRILGNAKKFEIWLSETHSLNVSSNIFQGYNFALACCINSFVSGLELDQSLGIQDDFYFQRALANLIPLQEIKLTCNKAKLIAGLKPFIRDLLKAKSLETVDKEYNRFETYVSSRFEQLYRKNVCTRNGLDKEICTRLSLINFAHTYLMQIGNNGPYAYQSTTLSPKWLDKKRLKFVLEGYKYAIQFLWHELLRKEQFISSSLENLHTADSWAEYTYIYNEEYMEDEFLFEMNREFDLEEQNNFDSYFYRIQEEVTKPLEEQYGFPIYAIDDYFYFQNETFDRNSFIKSITYPIVNDFHVKLDLNKQIQELLYWYSWELVDGEHNDLHFGVSSFNTMLAGTVSLFKPNKSEFIKPIIVRFVHPHESEIKNDYSYGILIDAKSSTNHYSSGWIIYQNVCGDYSGFSDSERMATEGLIKKYLRTSKIELRELIVPLKKFKAFTKQYERDDEKRYLGEQFQKNKKNLPPIKAHLFELLTYYILHRNYGEKFSYKLNSDRKSKEGERDIVLENDSEVILVECKLNVQNCDIQALLNKLERKIQTYGQKQKSCQLWTWENLSIQNKMALDKSGIRAISICATERDFFLRGINLKRLMELMRD